MTKYISILLAGFSLSSSAMEIEKSPALRLVIQLEGDQYSWAKTNDECKKEIIDPVACRLYTIFIRNGSVKMFEKHLITGHIYRREKHTIPSGAVLKCTEEWQEDVKKTCIVFSLQQKQ